MHNFQKTKTYVRMRVYCAILKADKTLLPVPGQFPSHLEELLEQWGSIGVEKATEIG